MFHQIFVSGRNCRFEVMVLKTVRVDDGIEQFGFVSAKSQIGDYEMA